MVFHSAEASLHAGELQPPAETALSMPEAMPASDLLAGASSSLDGGLDACSHICAC